MYLVVAYQWGATNKHQYFVYCGPDRDKALELAENEANERIRYKTAIYKFNAEGTEYAMEAFFPEDGEPPCYDWREYMFESLGHKMYNFARGSVSLPDPERKGFMTQVKVEPPEWVVSEVARAEKFVETVQEAAKKQRVGGRSDGK